MTDSNFEKMPVFLSWSGARSKEAAQIFRIFLPGILQNVRAYFTADDIEKGARWGLEIRKELEKSAFGIIFLTPENLNSPWILFEAGALSKLEKSHVAPILFDLEPTDVSGPLGQLQLTRFAKDECLELLKVINRSLERLGVEESLLESLFELHWKKIDADIQAAMSLEVVGPKPRKRSERDLLEEVLERVRAIETMNAKKPSEPVDVAEFIKRAKPRTIELAEAMSRDSVLSIPISSLNLPVETQYQLLGTGLMKVGDLVALNEKGLLERATLNADQMQKLRFSLARFGLSLAP